MSFLNLLTEEGIKGKASLRKTTTIVTDASGRRKNEATGALVVPDSQERPGFIVDTSPDPGLHKVIHGLYIGSHDASVNLNGISVPRKGNRGGFVEESQVDDCRQEEDYFPGISEIGITHVVNLYSRERPFEDMGIRYLNVTMLDLPEQPLSCINEALHFIHDAILGDAQEINEERPGNKVLVHCNAGISRASSVIIAYLIKHQGMSYKQALEQVRQNRSSARPNAGFEAQLLKLEKQCTYCDR